MAVPDGGIMPCSAVSRNPEKRSITFHVLEKMDGEAGADLAATVKRIHRFLIASAFGEDYLLKNRGMR
jgi:hypothetical protein